MKKITFSAALIFAILFAKAQQGNIIKITGTRFPFEIMQHWIDVYSSTHPGIKFQLSKAIPSDSADLVIAAHGFRPGELKDYQAIVAVNRYAQLPIVNSKRADLQPLQQKGFTQQDLKAVYFNTNETEKTDGLNGAVTVYRRDKKVCASRSFAENVTGSQLDVAGKLVTGDDRALSAAVKTDVNGFSYNNLGLIYNLETRKIVDSLAVVPIDLDENGKIDASEEIYATLDDVLDYLGSTGSTRIPQDDVNTVLNKNTASKNVLDFVNWVITTGQQYNRSFGFLNLSSNAVEQEKQLLASLAKTGTGVITKK